MSFSSSLNITSCGLHLKKDMRTDEKLMHLRYPERATVQWTDSLKHNSKHKTFSKNTALKPTCSIQNIFCSRSIPMPVINPGILSPYKNKEVNLLSVFVGVTADHYVNHITWNALQAQLIFPIREILLVVVITAECSVEKARVTRENKIK